SESKNPSALPSSRREEAAREFHHGGDSLRVRYRGKIHGRPSFSFPFAFFFYKHLCLIFPPMQVSAALPFGIREYAFADAGNLEHCAKYLNQTLVTFGFPASLDLFATDPVRSRSRGPATAFILCFNRDSGTSSLGRPPTIKDKGEFEAKTTANLKAQIEKLQQERDEFQKMVIGNQVDAYEVKKKELMAENSDLRALLRSMQVKNCNNKIISRLTWSTRTVADAHTSLFEIAIHEHDMDMRYFLNAPNGLPPQTSAVNEKEDAGSPQSPLGGRMVG
ncbi:hypothetical protein B296_00001634, partial [Ensete ventricosum]